MAKLSGFDCNALARCMTAFGKLRHVPDRAFLRAYYTELYAKLPLFDDQDLAHTMTAFSMCKKLLRQDFLTELLLEVRGVGRCIVVSHV